MEIRTSVVVVAASAMVGGQAGMDGFIQSRRQVDRLVTAQLRYGVARAGQPSTKSGQLTDDACCCEESSQAQIFLLWSDFWSSL